MPKNNIIDYIIGLPPNSTELRTNEVMRNSMPLVKIYPGVPSYTQGLSLFSRGDAYDQYESLLNSHDFFINQPNSSRCLVAAYQADSFPTDSFTNEYGENFLQSMTNIASEGAASIAQMLGVRSVGEGANVITKGLKKGGKMSQLVGSGIETAGEVARDLMSSLGSGVKSAAGLASALAAGGRIDFPMIWKGSSFQPSYTMTIRLFNPNPSSDEATKKYIVAPVAALLLLGLPQSGDNSGATYSWPFIHRIHSPGIYNLDPAFISNITVIKGGDQQQISFKQKLSVVDVRIDFGSLYSSMLASRGLSRTRPTLQTYLSSMYGRDQEKPVTKFSSTGLTPEEISSRENVSSRQEIRILKNQPSVEEPTQEEIQNPPNRITQSLRQLADIMKDSIPQGLKIG